MFADFSELREFAKLEACDSARQLEQKFELAKKYFDNKEWSKLTFLIERPYRFEFFYWLAIEMEVEVPSTLLYDVWTDTENPSINRSYFVEAFQKLSCPNKGIDDDDKKEFADLPNEFEVYRGVEQGSLKKSTALVCHGR